MVHGLESVPLLSASGDVEHVQCVAALACHLVEPVVRPFSPSVRYASSLPFEEVLRLQFEVVVQRQSCLLLRRRMLFSALADLWVSFDLQLLKVLPVLC